MNNKILKLLPNNKNLYAEYLDDDKSKFYAPIVCFALVEDDDINYVDAMILCDGEITLASIDYNFNGIVEL